LSASGVILPAKREEAGMRSAPAVAGGTGCEAPGLENPIKIFSNSRGF
jgi:hypothetical protein